MSLSKQHFESKELGTYLANLRALSGLSLRGVEEATNKTVSNAYLSQLENGHIAQPSPHILYSLSEVYSAPYEEIMERAGYIISNKDRKDNQKHGRLATLARQGLTKEEETELLNYLNFMRKRGEKK